MQMAQAFTRAVESLLAGVDVLSARIGVNGVLGIAANAAQNERLVPRCVTVTVLTVLLLLTLAIVDRLFFGGKRAKGDTILIAGHVEAGKTSLFYRVSCSPSSLRRLGPATN